MKVREDMISLFEKRFVIYRGRVPHNKVMVFDILREMFPKADRSTIEQAALELQAMGAWIERSAGGVENWQWAHPAFY